jgi:hypothetical protein
MLTMWPMQVGVKCPWKHFNVSYTFFAPSTSLHLDVSYVFDKALNNVHILVLMLLALTYYMVIGLHVVIRKYK